MNKSHNAKLPHKFHSLPKQESHCFEKIQNYLNNYIVIQYIVAAHGRRENSGIKVYALATWLVKQRPRTGRRKRINPGTY